MYQVNTVDVNNKKTETYSKLCSTIEIAREAVQQLLEDRDYRVAIFTIEVDVANSEKMFEIYQCEEGLIYKSEESDKEIGYLSMHWFVDGHILNADVPNALEYYKNHVAEKIDVTISKALLGKGVDGFYFELRANEQKHIADIYHGRIKEIG